MAGRDGVAASLAERRADGTHSLAPADPVPPRLVAAGLSAPAPSVATTPAASNPVVQKVLEIVSEKTGYPTDMLEMDLDLEADLGVDTVKQAETFAAVREAYGIARQENLKLRDFPTLKHVVEFVYQFRPDLKPRTASGGGGPTARAARPRGPARSERDRSRALPIGAPRTGGSASSNPVVQKVLEIVSEKTGYPTDMLEMDLDLEADLGVDTVKQAETFAAVREAYGIARQENLKLRDFPTLKHVVEFVYQFRPDLKPVDAPAEARSAGREFVGASDSVLRRPGTERAETASPNALPVGASQSATATVTPSAAPTSAAARPLARLEDADKMPRRVPVPSLRPPLELCKPTGVVLGKGTRVVVASDKGGVAEALAKRLAKDGVTVLALEAGVPTDAVTSRIAEWLREGPVQGVFWLPALDVEPALGEMDLAAFREANRRRVKNLFAAMKALYDSVAASGTFLVTGTRMGGLHGQTPEGATAPLGGAVAGFSKAYKRERGEALVKAVDFAPGVPAGDVAEALVAEALVDPGIVEVGRHDDLRSPRRSSPRPSPTPASSRWAVTTTCAGRLRSRSGRRRTAGRASSWGRKACSW